MNRPSPGGGEGASYLPLKGQSTKNPINLFLNFQTGKNSLPVAFSERVGTKLSHRSIRSRFGSYDLGQFQSRCIFACERVERRFSAASAMPFSSRAGFNPAELVMDYTNCEIALVLSVQFVFIRC